MAKKEIKIKLSTTGKNKTEKDIRGVEGSIGSLAKSALTLAVAYKVASAALDAVKLAGKLEDLENAHKNLAKAQGLNAKTMIKEMQVATRGTVKEVDLLQQANNALLLGLPIAEGDMGRLADAGRRLGRAMGIDAAMGLESLVVGIGRGSKLWLDNLGIIVDTNQAYQKHAKILGKQASTLTDTEKKLAFYNETMESVDLKMKTLGVDTETVTDKFAQAGVAVERIEVAFGNLLKDPVADFLGGTADAAEYLEKSMGEKGLWGTLVGLLTPMRTGKELGREYAESLREIAKEQAKIKKDQYEGMTEKEIQQAKALAMEVEARKAHEKAIAEIQDKILINQANSLLREQALLELKQQGLVPYTEEELLTQRIDAARKQTFDREKETIAIKGQQIKQESILSRARKEAILDAKQTKDLNMGTLQINTSQIETAAQFAGQLARGLELFRGMDAFAKSVLVSLQRMAEQLASRALGGLIGGGLGFLLGGPAGWGIGANIGSGGLFGKRAEGGPVEAGRPYIVGEKRPELFIPDRGGTIMPEVGGNNLTINLNGVFHGSVDELADEIVDRSEQGFNRVAVNA